MKLTSKLSALGLVALASATFASASPVYFGSYASTAANPGFSAGVSPLYVSPDRAATYTLDPGTTWHAPLSINGVQSSWVGINPLDGPTTGTTTGHQEPNGTYELHSYFLADYNSYLGGSLTALADDTVDVFLNGHQVVMNSEAMGGSFTTCSDVTPNCTMIDSRSIGALLNSYFKTDGSVNDLKFVLYQSANYANGLDFVGVAATPEPSTLLLLGTGLIGSAGALFRRMRS